MSLEDFGTLDTDEAHLELIALGVGIVAVGVHDGLQEEPANRVIRPLGVRLVASFLMIHLGVDEEEALLMAESLMNTALEGLK